MEALKQKIRQVPNWPKKGITFYDITTLLQDKIAFKRVVNEITRPYLKQKIDKVAAVDARGFLIAAPVAYKLGAGLAILRKKGKLPYKTISKKYIIEYAAREIEIHKDAVLPGERVLLIDDLNATGGTALAACSLIEKLGGKVMGISFVIDLPFLGGSKKLIKRGYKTRSLISYESE